MLAIDMAGPPVVTAASAKPPPPSSRVRPLPDASRRPAASTGRAFASTGRAAAVTSATGINLDDASSKGNWRRLSSEADPARHGEDSQYDRSVNSSAVVSTADHFASLAQMLTTTNPNGLGPVTKTATHDAIIHHFQLRHMSPRASYARRDDDDELHTDNQRIVDGSLNTLFATRRMLQLGRKSKSTRDSMAASMRDLQAHKHKQKQHAAVAVSRGSCRRQVVQWGLAAWQTMRALLKTIKKPWSPHGVVAHVRSVVLCLALLTQIVLFPFAPVYFPHGSRLLTACCIAYDTVSLLDLLVSVNTSFCDPSKPHQLEKARSKIWKHFLGTRGKVGLLVDAIASLPVASALILAHSCQYQQHQWPRGDTLGLAVGMPHSVLRMLRWYWLLSHTVQNARAVRVTKQVSVRLSLQRYPHSGHVARVVWLLMLTTHYIACAARLLRSGANEEEEEDATPWTLYTSDLFLAVQLVVGHNPSPSDTRETRRQPPPMVFSIIVMLVGCLVLAVVTSQVALTLVRSQANSSRYHMNLTKASAAMDKMHLPPLLKRHIHQYHDHLWTEHDATDGSNLASFSDGLSPSLALEVRLFKYMDLVLGVPFWRNCSADFVTQIMLQLQVRAYLPEDYVMRQGEISDTLFLLNRGVCELEATRSSSDPDDSLAVAIASARPRVRQLTAGVAFGELALLMNYKRTATVKALTFVDMCVLTRQAFQQILARYRDDRREVLREILLSCMEKQAQKFVPFPWEELVQNAVAQRPDKPPPATPWEAAEVLVDLICAPESTDGSVQFGFKDLDFVSQHRLLPVVQQQQPMVDAVPAVTVADDDGTTMAARLQRMEQWQSQASQQLEKIEQTMQTMTTALAALSAAVGGAGPFAGSAGLAGSDNGPAASGLVASDNSLPARPLPLSTPSSLQGRRLSAGNTLRRLYSK